MSASTDVQETAGRGTSASRTVDSCSNRSKQLRPLNTDPPSDTPADLLGSPRDTPKDLCPYPRLAITLTALTRRGTTVATAFRFLWDALPGSSSSTAATTPRRPLTILSFPQGNDALQFSRGDVSNGVDKGGNVGSLVLKQARLVGIRRTSFPPDVV